MTKPAKPRRPDVAGTELVGGIEHRELCLEDYDSRWPGLYQEQHRRIRTALPAPEVGIDHIGSTSVPGLAAKPIIDIVVTVPDITAEEDYLGPLLAAGYELRVREPGHRMVRTPARDVHVHILDAGDPAVGEYLLFRGRLRSDPADRARYESTKRELLLRDWPDMNDYAEAKTEVISAIKLRGRASVAPLPADRQDIP